jgi:hypothetical protein
VATETVEGAAIRIDLGSVVGDSAVPVAAAAPLELRSVLLGTVIALTLIAVALVLVALALLVVTIVFGYTAGLA